MTTVTLAWSWGDEDREFLQGQDPERSGCQRREPGRETAGMAADCAEILAGCLARGGIVAGIG